MAGADHVRPLSLERETTIRPLPLPASAHAAYTAPFVWSTPELAKLSVRKFDPGMGSAIDLIALIVILCENVTPPSSETTTTCWSPILLSLSSKMT